MQSLFLCWDILLHDVRLGDTTCTDQDEDEERDAPVSCVRFLDIGGRGSEREVDGFGKTLGASRFGNFPPLCEEDFPFILSFLPLPRVFARLRLSG